VVVADTPLFQGYVFCRFDPLNRLPILTTTGVISIVGCGTEPASIDDQEIDAIEAILRSGLATEPCPFLREGQKVRVRRGSLAGVEGILTKKKSDFRLVISVTMLQRSIAVEIDREWIEVV
jgi:transcription antitermination factor NusG